MAGRMNCWLYGLLTSVVMLVLVHVPMLVAGGCPEKGQWMPAIAVWVVTLAAGTLIFGILERRKERNRQGGEEKQARDGR